MRSPAQTATRGRSCACDLRNFGLYAGALLDLLYAEFTLALGAPAATELQQQGLVRRRPSGTYFQATDDVRFSLLLDEPLHSR